MAATPQDHKPAKGFIRLGDRDFPLRRHLDDDWQFIELSDRASTGRPAAQVEWVRYVLDDDDDAYEALKAAAVVDDHVSMKRVVGLLNEALEASNPN